MKFEFTKTKKVNTYAWEKCNGKLEQDLHEITTKSVSENEITSYLYDMIGALKPVGNGNCSDMFFLMYDEPSTMPSDARVDFVYKPTYIASAIIMTAMNRFDRIAENDDFKKAANSLLEASLGREFRGAGYNGYTGYMETLQIFGTGDTLEFLEKYPHINERFTHEFKEAVQFLEDEICSGKIRDMWSGDTYSARGNEVLAMFKNKDIKSRYVWYACYGSNVNKERFMKYIKRCSDTTPPVADIPFSFNHNIYFAKKTTRWDNGGKAFLDDSRPGFAHGRAYKITRKQFEEVKVQEGDDYTKEIYLGQIDGWPVYTFTDTQKNSPERLPSIEYFKTILEGIQDCYKIAIEDGKINPVEYLVNAVFPENTFAVVRAIKNSTHGVANNQLSRLTHSDYESTVSAVKWLVEHSVIKQYSRSVHAGHQIDDPEAYFFTVDSPCARELVKFIIEECR